MTRPTAPYAYAQMTPEDWAAIGQMLAAEHVRSDESDPLAPARGVMVAVALGAAFWLGLAWPFGSWVAAGSW